MKTKLFLPFLAILLIITACYNKSSELQSFKNKFQVNILTAEQLAKIIYSNDTNKFVFIDIRNPHQYKQGHLKNAINIPSKYADSKDYNDIWQNDKIKIIYGNSTSDAVLLGYWLNYQNIPNILVATGGYEKIQNYIINSYSIYSANFDDEKPYYDYKKFISEISASGSSSATEQQTQTPTLPIQNVQTSEGEVSGGCE